MSREENIRVARLYIEEIWNNKRIELIDEVFHPDYDKYSREIADNKPGLNSSLVWYTALDDDFSDRTNQIRFLKKLVRLYYETIPDLHYEIRRIIADDHQVAVFAVNTGTPAKKFGIFYPMNKKYAMDCTYYFEFRDGKIINLLFVFDSLTTFSQTGMAKLNWDEHSSIVKYLITLNESIINKAKSQS